METGLANADIQQVNETMDLYEYQKHVAETLKAGQSVILQAPTGSGKTVAALWPFLEQFGRHNGGSLPRKCIYSVPMRCLANQFVSSARDLVERELHSPVLPTVAIQTGERPEDRRFESDLIFATIDQTLSSFAHMPYSLSRKQANLNAGAVASSYLVFDEFHLFDPTSTLPTTLEMLRILGGVAPFILMTATFSTGMLRRLGKLVGASIVPSPDNTVERQQMLDLPAERSKTRFYHWSETPLDADSILTRHEGHRRSLVVCNTVERAQRLYRALRDHPACRAGTQVILLHSRFLQSDRAAKERCLLNWYGKAGDRQTGSVIAVATQVIEVGLDMSAEILHTELAPANAILQRAGRCARYAHEVGHVYVYAVDNYAPYAMAGPNSAAARRTIDQTRDWLRQHDAAQPIRWNDEQSWIDAAHSEADDALLQALAATAWQHRGRLRAAFAGHTDEAGDLVRKVASQSLTISADPGIWSEKPFDAPLFSLHPGSLGKAVRRWLELPALDSSTGPHLWKLVEQSEHAEDRHTRYGWQAIGSDKEVRGAALVAVHPGLARYDSDEGLVLDEGGAYWDEMALASRKRADERQVVSSAYCLESYAQHVERTVKQFSLRTWPEIASAAGRLELRAGWPVGSVKRAAMLAVLFHDVGKLTAASDGNRGWQPWAHEWQRRVGGATLRWYAHTDYDGSPAQREIEKKMGPRPSHALEGAVAVSPLLAQALRDQPALLKAAFSAVGRHHGAFTSNFRRYQLVADVRDAVGETMTRAVPHNARLDVNSVRITDDPLRTSVDRLLVDGADDNELVAYVLIARCLRRADQAGTAEGHH